MNFFPKNKFPSSFLRKTLRYHSPLFNKPFSNPLKLAGGPFLPQYFDSHYPIYLTSQFNYQIICRSHNYEVLPKLTKSSVFLSIL